MRTSMLREILVGCRHTKSLNRINDIENKIGAGLVEEVIMVAEGELTLVDEMIAAKVYALSLAFLMDSLLTHLQMGTP